MVSFHLSEKEESASFSKSSSPALRIAHQEFYLDVLHFIYSLTQHFLGVRSESAAIIDIKEK